MKKVFLQIGLEESFPTHYVAIHKASKCIKSWLIKLFIQVPWLINQVMLLKVHTDDFMNRHLVGLKEFSFKLV